MTHDEFIALAKEAGFDEESGDVIVGYYSDDITDKLERFAQLVAEKERDECYHAVRGASLYLDGVALTANQTMAIYEQLSAPIRARKP